VRTLLPREFFVPLQSAMIQSTGKMDCEVMTACR
jgi:hypothetical protein